MQTTVDPNALTQPNGRAASPATLPALEAQRQGVESALADHLHDQVYYLLDKLRDLRKGRPLDCTGVAETLQAMLCTDIGLLGQLQAYDYLEHPGSLSRPPALRPPGARP